MLDQSATQTCPNCDKEIPSSRFTMHEVQCSRHIQKCDKCGKPCELRGDGPETLENHVKAEHAAFACGECGEQIEGTRAQPAHAAERCRRPCPDCSHVQCGAVKMALHKEHDCRARFVVCYFCQSSFPFAELWDHKEQCGARTEECHLCQQFVMLKDMQRHSEERHGGSGGVFSPGAAGGGGDDDELQRALAASMAGGGGGGDGEDAELQRALALSKQDKQTGIQRVSASHTTSSHHHQRSGSGRSRAIGWQGGLSSKSTGGRAQHAIAASRGRSLGSDRRQSINLASDNDDSEDGDYRGEESEGEDEDEQLRRAMALWQEQGGGGGAADSSFEEFPGMDGASDQCPACGEPCPDFESLQAHTAVCPRQHGEHAQDNPYSSQEQDLQGRLEPEPAAQRGGGGGDFYGGGSSPDALRSDFQEKKRKKPSSKQGKQKRNGGAGGYSPWDKEGAGDSGSDLDGFIVDDDEEEADDEFDNGRANAFTAGRGERGGRGGRSRGEEQYAAQEVARTRPNSSSGRRARKKAAAGGSKASPLALSSASSHPYAEGNQHGGDSGSPTLSQDPDAAMEDLTKDDGGGGDQKMKKRKRLRKPGSAAAAAANRESLTAPTQGGGDDSDDDLVSASWRTASVAAPKSKPSAVDETNDDEDSAASGDGGGGDGGGEDEEQDAEWAVI